MVQASVGMAAPKGLAFIAELAMKEPSVSLAAAGAAVSAPYIAYIIAPSTFVAHADSRQSATASTSGTNDPFSKSYVQSRSFWSTFAPDNLLKMALKNVGLSLLLRVNGYMLELLEHEKLAVENEEQGEAPPPPPDFPDLSPALSQGLYGFGREALVTSVRRLYEHLAVWKLPAATTMDLLTDSRAYIRDVLALIHQYDPIHVKLYSYANTTLRAWALFYAADCTVAIGIHTISTVMRARRNRGGAAKAIRHWAKGAGLHVLRCSATLAAVSAGAALGSAIQPGPGTILGHFATDLAVSNTFFIVINSALA